MGDVYSLIERAHRGDKEARDTLVYENTGLVWSVVRRFSYSGADREELFQIGVIGLLKAIDRFDPSFQVCFSTYAVPAISGELKRFLRDDGPIKISRSIQDHQKQMCIRDRAISATPATRCEGTAGDSISGNFW